MTPPDPNVQHVFWYVIAALGIIIGGVVVMFQALKWGRHEILEVVSTSVSEAMTAALKAHEDRERGWRDKDNEERRESEASLRKEFRNDIRDLRDRLDRLQQDLYRMEGRSRGGSSLTDALEEVERLRRELGQRSKESESKP